jgi:hypothetical protein
MEKSKVKKSKVTKSNNLKINKMEKSKVTKSKVTKSNKVSACQQKVDAAKIPTDPKAILTVYQIAKLLGVTAYQVYALEIKDRKLDAVKKFKSKMK